MKARIGELAQQKGEIEARLAEAPADLPDVHPNIAEHYRAKVLRLAETLAEPESNGEAREDIRSLVGEVVITPGDKRGESHAILKGELMAILDLAAGRPRSPKTEVITNALACPRLEPTIRQVSEFRRTIGGNIADLRTPDCAVRSDHSFTTSLYSDKGKFHSDLHAARIMNMSEYALNQSSLRMTLNHRVPGSSPGAPTKSFKNLAI
jgi:hypothetical protein